MNDSGADPIQISGRVKWFDPAKGFGFIVSDEGGSDVLLHANVLRNFGQGSVADNARIIVNVQKTARGAQAVEVIEITPPESTEVIAATDEHIGPDQAEIDLLPVHPARVKWFDKTKGFGFANLFGSSQDVFIHIEVLRRSGFSDLQPGEAVGLRVVDGKRGQMAAQVLAWDATLKERG